MKESNEPLAIIPKHVGLIPNGTRRWAKKHQMDYETAYRLGAKNIFDFINFMFDKGVSTISIYGLSVDNLKRSPQELEKILAAETYSTIEILPKILDRHSIRIKHVGNMSKLPDPYVQAIKNVCELTKNNTEGTLYILVAYDAIEEVYTAAKRAENPQTLFENLWVPEKIDLLIRTSGEYRISNFLPLQAGYAELVFFEQAINDFTEKDWQSALDQFEQRKRRFGA